MYRGAGLLELIHGSVPDWLLVLAAIVTRLGDVWIVIGLTIGASWLLTWTRFRRGSTGGRSLRAVGDDGGTWLVGVLITGLAAMTALKYGFALPRPELVATTPGLLPPALESSYVATVTLGGYGFPSGHAVGATVAYGLLAIAVRVGTRRARFVAAALLAVAISLSRVVLAVHYPADIVAGIVLGVVLLGSVLWLFERTATDRTTVAFTLALALAVVAVAVSGGSGRSVTYAMFAAAGLACWSFAQFIDHGTVTTVGYTRSALFGAGSLVVFGLLVDSIDAVLPIAALGVLAVAPAVLVVVTRRSP